MKDCKALILAAGNSERMGFPKAYLMYQGKSFLENSIGKFRDAGINNISVVLHKENCETKWNKFLEPVELFAMIIKNQEPERGRFHSLKLGIENSMNADFLFIHNVDNPVIEKKTIEQLWKNKNPDGYTSILFNGRKGHPILISKKIIHHINSMEDKDYNLRDVLPEFPESKVETNNAGVLVNINTPEDFKSLIQEYE